MNKLGLLFIVFFLTCCSYHDNDECLNHLDENFVTKIDSTKIVDLNREVDCFEWDSLIFTEPAASEDLIENKTGISISPFRLMGPKSIFSSDFYSFIIFLKGKRIVGKLEITGGINPENLLDGTKNRDLTVISRKDAVFKIYWNKNDYYTNGNKIYNLGFAKSNDSLKY